MATRNRSTALVRQPLKLPRFVHRHNIDDSFDSICTDCARTVANDQMEAALISAEKRHQCEGTFRRPPQRAV